MAKGKSPVTAKMDAYRARMYTDAQRMNYEPCHCEGVSRPPGWVLDLAADRALSGGFKTRVGGKSNICDKCRQARSVNGACGC